MHRPTLFKSFFMAGFECSTQRRADGRRLDLLAGTRHDRFVEADYRRMQGHGLRTMRDGLRWHLIEQSPGEYDFGSFAPMLQAATRQGVEVIWDLCHYGWPDDIDIWRPAFVDRFARYAAAAARYIRDASPGVHYYCPINEISFWSWAGGDAAVMFPMAHGRGFELKQQLTRAAMAGMRAVMEADRDARFIHAEPLIHVVGGSPQGEEDARGYRRAQYDAWLLTNGALWPGLGGDPSLLDIVGINHYPANQWVMGGEENGRTLPPSDPRYRPLRELLIEAWQLLRRPMLIAETGAEGPDRVTWLRYVIEESVAALQADVPLEGICLYPVLDYPGWMDDRHCDTGLYGVADEQGERLLHEGLAEVLQQGMDRLRGLGCLA